MYRICPRDHSPLSAHEWGVASYLLCDACHGVLLEAPEAKKILPSGTHPPLAQPEEEPLFEDGTALCSCSGTAMKTVSRDGVIVDLCPSCKAIWFDGGELQRVVVAKRKQFLISDPPEGPPRRSEGLEVIDALGEILATLFWTLT